MAYSKKAIRHMSPQTRKFARLVNELDSTTKRLRNLINNSDITASNMPSSSKQLHKGKVILGMKDRDSGQPLFPGIIELEVNKKAVQQGDSEDES
jgi:hypothetical protein